LASSAFIPPYWFRQRLNAVRALGEAGEPRALDHLRWLRSRATTDGQRQTIGLAIERVELLSQPDPVPDLIHLVEASAAERRIDEWALRHLARRADPRSVEPLSRVFVEQSHRRRALELLAAALLAHGGEGREALARAAQIEISDVREVASIATSLGAGVGPAVPLSSAKERALEEAMTAP